MRCCPNSDRLLSTILSDPVSSSSRCNKPCLDTKLALSQEIQSNTRLSDPPSPQSSDEPGPGIQEALKAHKEAKDLVSGDIRATLSELTSPCLFQALVRDGFRCIVTGIYDRTTLSEVSASPRRDPGCIAHRPCTHCSRIHVFSRIRPRATRWCAFCLFFTPLMSLFLRARLCCFSVGSFEVFRLQHR